MHTNKKHKDTEIILKTMATFYKLQFPLESVSGHSYSYFTQWYNEFVPFFPSTLEI